MILVANHNTRRSISRSVARSGGGASKNMHAVWHDDPDRFFTSDCRWLEQHEPDDLTADGNNVVTISIPPDWGVRLADDLSMSIACRHPSNDASGRLLPQ